MPDYKYEALDKSGKTIAGTMTADSQGAVRDFLRGKDMFLVSIDEARGDAGGTGWWPDRVSLWQLCLFTRRMAGLLSSGLTIDRALHVAGTQAESARMRNVVEELRKEVVEGNSLSGALKRRQDVFPEIFAGLTAAGEKSGRLDIVFTRLAAHLEKSVEMRRRVAIALIYPAAVTCIAAISAMGLAIFVVPQLAEAFTRANRHLPMLTRGLIWTSGVIRDGYHLMVPAMAIAAFTAWRAARREKWRRRFHELALAVPVAGKVAMLADSSRFARTLATLLSSGAPLVTALGTAGGAMSNPVLRERAEAVAVRVNEGESLSRAIDSTGIFPVILTSFTSAGEKSGKLAESLDAASDQMTSELDTRISALTAMLEPALVVFMGGLVLLVALAALLPMFEMNRLKI